MRLSCVAATGLVLAAWQAPAHAAPPPAPRTARHAVAPQPRAAGASQLALSRLVYLNRTGVVVSPGASNSALNTSTIATQRVQVPGWTVEPQIWTDTVACIKEMFAPWDLAFTETDPGAVPHIEAVFGGAPVQFGLDPDISGISPFTTDCSIIEGSMVFTFVNVIRQDARTICEVQAQEIAHSFGLDHELLAQDPMTYLPYAGERAFTDQLANCGESTPRPCGISGSTCRTQQNSVALLTERLGRRPGAPAGQPGTPTPSEGDGDDLAGGCQAGGGPGGGLAGLGGLFAVAWGLARRRRG